MVEHARRWLLQPGPRDFPFTATLAGPASSIAIDDLLAQWPLLAAAGDVRAEPDATVALKGATRAYVGYAEDDESVRTAIQSMPDWTGDAGSFVLCLGRVAPLGVAGPGLVARMGGPLRIVRITEVAIQPESIVEDLAEELARAIHEQYLRSGSGVGSVVLRPWVDLPESLREGNRSMAADIGRKLSAVNATVGLRTRANASAAFTPAEVEVLAVSEHDRWLRQRLQAGWRHGQYRDDERRLHPSMVDWERLSEPDRQRDREAVLVIPDVLGAVGLAIVRN